MFPELPRDESVTSGIVDGHSSSCVGEVGVGSRSGPKEGMGMGKKGIELGGIGESSVGGA